MKQTLLYLSFIAAFVLSSCTDLNKTTHTYTLSSTDVEKTSEMSNDIEQIYDHYCAELTTVGLAIMDEWKADVTQEVANASFDAGMQQLQAVKDKYQAELDANKTGWGQFDFTRTFILKDNDVKSREYPLNFKFSRAQK